MLSDKNLKTVLGQQGIEQLVHTKVPQSGPWAAEIIDRDNCVLERMLKILIHEGYLFVCLFQFSVTN